MTECKISIVIPVYNVEKYIEKCLDSVVSQTMQGFEVIIVNDGSKDNSPLLLNKYKEAYPSLITVYDTENKGVSHARNYGVKKAKGKYILFVDSDDYIENNMCELLYNKAAEDDADIVICERNDFSQYEETGNIRVTKSTGFYMPFNRKIDLSTMKYELAHISPFPWDKLYRKELLYKFPFPEGIRFEDLAVMYQILLSARIISVIPEYLYNYRRTSEGGFLNTFSKETKDIVKACQKITEDFKENEWFEEYYEEVEYICARHLLLRYGVLFDIEQKGKLNLKKELIHETQDFLDKNYPNWRKNRYLKYSPSQKMKQNFEKYKNKKVMLRKASYYEYMPGFILKTGIKLSEKLSRFKKSMKRFIKSRQKRKLLVDNVPFLKIFRQSPSAQYTYFYEKLSVNPKLVLYESKHGEDIAGNIFRMLYSMEEDRYRKFTIQLVLKERYKETYEKLLSQYGMDYAEIILFGSPEYFKALACSKYLITDTSFPVYFIKRPEQIYMNTWHGTPLKGMGRWVPNREYALGNIQRNFLAADYLIYQNEFSRDIFLKDYMLDRIYGGNILVSGYPRNSAFFDEESRNRIRKELNAEDKTIIAYMPTWRGVLTKKETERQVYILLTYLRAIDKSLSEDQIFYVKLHPYVKRKINYKEFLNIMPFPEEYETYDFLNSTDILVTDYSSIMFDYAASGRDIVLFVYDKEEYVKERGLYLDIDELEFSKAYTVKGLMKALKKPAGYKEFRAAYCAYDNIDTAESTVKLLFFNENKGLKIKRIEDTGKKKVLILLGGMGKGDKTMQLIKYLNNLDTEKHDYYLCMNQATVKSATSMLSQLKQEIYYFPLAYGINTTKREKLTFALFFRFGIKEFGIKEKIQRMAARENRKYFGGLTFDYVINYSIKDKMLHLISQEMDGKKILNMQEFDSEKSKNNKYIKLLKYLMKNADKYDRIYAVEETRHYNKALSDRIEVIANEAIFVDEMIKREDGLWL